MTKKPNSTKSSCPKSFYGIKDPFSKGNWMKSGLLYGAMMFVTMGVIFPYLDGEEISVKNLAIGIVIWAMAGLAFGFTMKWVNDKQKTK